MSLAKKKTILFTGINVSVAENLSQHSKAVLECLTQGNLHSIFLEKMFSYANFRNLKLRLNDIPTQAGLEIGAATNILTTLMELDIIRRETPATEKIVKSRYT